MRVLWRGRGAVRLGGAGTVRLVVLPSFLAPGSDLLVTAGLLAVVVVLLVVWRRERQLAAAQVRLRTLVEARAVELEDLKEQLAEARATELEGLKERLAGAEGTDALTGLPNRRAILDRGAQTLAFARRHHTPLAVALLDVDHLEEVNDALGHVAGDTLLRQVATALRSVLRAEDVLGRFDGDQLLALLPGTPVTGVLYAGERLREAVGGITIATGLPGAPAVASTVSVGVTTLRPGDVLFNEVLRRADEALDRAKAAGRNRVEVA
jgi:diguanylate cyclase (GGDEF)-like protein